MLGQLMQNFTLILPKSKQRALKVNSNNVITDIMDFSMILPLSESELIKADGYWEIDPRTKKPFFNQKRFNEENLL